MYYFDFLGIKICSIEPNELIQKIVELGLGNQKHSISYVNAHCMNISAQDIEYKNILNHIDLVYADGIGVVFGAKFLNLSLPCRITAADVFFDFCRKCSSTNLKLYFLGGRPGIAGEAASKLKQKITNLSIIGYHDGYFTDKEESIVLSDINKKQPDILVIGLGAPIQEKWVNKNFNFLNVKVFWCVGGLFDLISGNLRRGPKWMTDNNLEWLSRLIITPHKVWKRYLIGIPMFFINILKYRFGY